MFNKTNGKKGRKKKNKKRAEIRAREGHGRLDESGVKQKLVPGKTVNGVRGQAFNDYIVSTVKHANSAVFTKKFSLFLSLKPFFFLTTTQIRLLLLLMLLLLL